MVRDINNEYDKFYRKVMKELARIGFKFSGKSYAYLTVSKEGRTKKIEIYIEPMFSRSTMYSMGKYTGVRVHTGLTMRSGEIGIMFRFGSEDKIYDRLKEYKKRVIGYGEVKIYREIKENQIKNRVQSLRNKVSSKKFDSWNLKIEEKYSDFKVSISGLTPNEAEKLMEFLNRLR